MSTATPFSTSLDQLIDEVEGLGYKFTTVAINAGTVTTNEPEFNKDGANAPGERFQNGYLFVPSGVAADRVRSNSTIAVAAGVTTITHNGPDTAAGGGAQTAYLLSMNPLHLIRIGNDALGLEYNEMTVPLSLVTDGDMQTSGVTNWTDTSATSSKVTTAANVFFGLRGMRVLLSGASGYTVNAANVRISRGKSWRAWAIVRADVGTAILRVVDASGNSLATVQTTEENWTYVWVDFTPGSTIEEIAFRLEGSGATDDIYVAAVGFQRVGERLVYLPSWATKRDRIRSLSVASYTGSGSETGAVPAFSRVLASLEEGLDYRFIAEPMAANVSAIEILPAGIARHPSLLNSPLWITGERPYSDIESFTVISDTSTIEPERLVTRMKYLLGKNHPAYFTGLREVAEEEILGRIPASTTREPERVRTHIRGTRL